MRHIEFRHLGFLGCRFYIVQPVRQCCRRYSSQAYLHPEIAENHLKRLSMRILTTHEADQLLFCKGMRIGKWNELTDISTDSMRYVAYQPPTNALELYVVAKQLLDWIALGGWVLLQIDNSTAPAPDEIKIFEKLVFPYTADSIPVSYAKSGTETL